MDPSKHFTTSTNPGSFSVYKHSTSNQMFPKLLKRLLWVSCCACHSMFVNTDFTDLFISVDLIESRFLYKKNSMFQKAYFLNSFKNKITSDESSSL